MNEQEERVLDSEEWKNEATAVINDVNEFVGEILISESIPASNSSIYCNLTTLEGEKYCVELTSAGFRIVGHCYNSKSNPREQYFETPYSLLNTISPKYQESFCSSLAAKLSVLKDSQENSIDESK